MQQTGWSNKRERAEMGLHPSIRSLLAANAGFTTGNGTSLPKRTLSVPNPSSHLPSLLELNSSDAHIGAKEIPLFGRAFLFCFVFYFLPSLVLESGATCLPRHQRGALTPGHSGPGWLNRLQSDTCASAESLWTGGGGGGRLVLWALLILKAL